jgi:hypothetical protein
LRSMFVTISMTYVLSTKKSKKWLTNTRLGAIVYT